MEPMGAGRIQRGYKEDKGRPPPGEEPRMIVTVATFAHGKMFDGSGR